MSEATAVCSCPWPRHAKPDAGCPVHGAQAGALDYYSVSFQIAEGIFLSACVQARFAEEARFEAQDRFAANHPRFRADIEIAVEQELVTVVRFR